MPGADGQGEGFLWDVIAGLGFSRMDAGEVSILERIIIIIIEVL